MRILIQGTGSIGQRHYRNLRKLGHEVALLRNAEVTRPFIKEFFDHEREFGNEPLVFFRLDDAVRSFHPVALFVCTPNANHLFDARAGVDAGLHLFIEKPVHNNLEGLQGLQESVSDKGLIVQIGYQLRFHPLLAKVKEMVSGGELGKILSASVEVGENIADWHPWEDYRETYAPWIRSGGGSLLCFSHDIDYLYWILGRPERVHAFGGKITPLEGDAEDLIQSLWCYKDRMTATFHVDYWQRPKVRRLKLIGTTRTCVWEEAAPLCMWEHESGAFAQIPLPEEYERNDMFLEEANHFVDCVNESKNPITSLAQGIEVLEIIERIKQVL
jgi:predicted dehydrogenase